MRTRFAFVASIALAALVIAGAGVDTASPPPPAPYRFGVVPQFEQRKLYAVWKPIVDELARRTGLTFNLETTLKIQDFEKAFARGDFDFVYVNPYLMVQGNAAQGYLPLVADTAPLRGVLVVQHDSRIGSPRELDGMSVAFPSPNALGASLLMRADLAQLFGATPVPLYVKTHSSVYLHVAKGLVAAGGGVEKTLAEQPEAIRQALRVLYTTRPMPSHPVAAHPRVAASDRDAVRATLLAMASDAAGRELIAHVPIRALKAAALADYLAMVPWGLERYWEPIAHEE